MKVGAQVTITARALQSSAERRIWSTLFDPRDWISYVYVPIIVPTLVLTPYFVIKVYERAHRINEIVQSLAEESRDLEEMTRLLDGFPEPFIGEKAEGLSSPLLKSRFDQARLPASEWQSPRGRRREG
jgi:hypothetical protein